MHRPILYLLIALSFAGAAHAAAPAGQVTLVTGSGTASSADGTIRALAKGDAVYPGDLVTSGPNSFVNLKFSDGGFVLLRPNSRFTIEDYAFTPSLAPPPAAAAQPVPAQPAAAPSASAAAPATGGASRAFFRLLKGGFRAVTGLIGKVNRDDYRVSTPVATIGIRGTDYISILCDAACAADPVLSAELPGGVSAEGGLILSVVDGGITLNNAQGLQSSIGVDQYLAVLPDGSFVPLPAEPHFLRVDPLPNPQSCSQ